MRATGPSHRRCLAFVVVAGLICASLVAPARAGGADKSANVMLVATVPLEWESDPERPVLGPMYAGELAFRDRLIVGAVQGNHPPVRGAGDHYESGIATFRISRRDGLVRQVGSFRCHGVGELSLWGDLVLQGVVSSQETGIGLPRDRCDRNGFRMIDVSNPRRPHAVAFMPVPCGVGDHALVLAGRRLYAYVPSTCDEQTETFTNGGVFGEISVFRIRPGDPPRSAHVGIADLLPMNGCSELAVSLVRDLAVCTANIDNRFGLLDISDPAAPKLIDGSVTIGWSPGSPAFTWDGSHLIMAADRSFSTAGTTPDDVSLLIYNIEDVTNPLQVGSWTAPDLPGEDNRVYSITAVPLRDGRDVIAVAHANKGFWLVDVTDPSAPWEIGHHVPAPEDVQPNPADPEESFGKSDTVNAYWYNGRFYAGNLGRLQVFRVKGFNRRTTHFYKGSYNPQTLRRSFL